MELNKRATKLKQTQQRNWSNASQGGQTALKEHVAVLHSETASTTQQPRGEHRDTIKDCKIAGATTCQGQGNHTFTTLSEFCYFNALIDCPYFPRFLHFSNEPLLGNSRFPKRPTCFHSNDGCCCCYLYDFVIRLSITMFQKYKNVSENIARVEFWLSRSGSGSQSMGRDPNKGAKGQKMGRTETIPSWVVCLQHLHCLFVSVCSGGTEKRIDC